MKWSARLFALAILATMGILSYWWLQERREHSQDIPILAVAKRYAMEPALIKAVVWRESNFNPDSRGRAGEIGLMQVIPKASVRDYTNALHVSFPAEHLFDPGTNITVGAWYLQKLLKRYAAKDNPLPYALADYNAGRANVLKWDQGAASTNSQLFIEQIGFPSTKFYVKSVMQRHEHYRPVFPSKEN